MCFFHATANAADGKPSGIDQQYIDTAVRPQDDLFTHANGKWLRDVSMPADRARFGSFDLLRDQSEANVRAIIEQLAARTDLAPGSEDRKIADLYRSFMDEARAEQLDAAPLLAVFARIDGLTSRAQVPTMLAALGSEGITIPLGMDVSQDARDSTRYLLHLYQDGIGLPDRDYYLKDDDQKLAAVRAAYQVFVAHTFTMLGLPEAEARAQAARVLDIETALARVQITKVELRDPVKRYNKMTVADLQKRAPAFDWPVLLAASGVPLDKVPELIVGTPSFFDAASRLLADLPLADLRAYLKWQSARYMMPQLSKRFVDVNFDFYGKTLRGVPEDRPRWKRGVELVETGLGEAVGREYVARHFPPQAKARMDELVANLMTAYRQSIDGLTWMTADTRAAAQAKLAKYTVKIGYPVRWRDYSTLEVKADDLTGNLRRIEAFQNARAMARLGKPVDREEWFMTPQTVNAYYNPGMNEIVFPAAILQPPFFDFQADDAVNYGGIGAVIGHEISHGFDDQGSQYDGDGNLRDWWSSADHAQFAERTDRLVAQYERYETVPGYRVNGKLTLGENIADNSGLAIAYKAYHLALAGRTAPVIDALTGDQRLYMGWVQVWRGKARESEAIRLIKVDPHSPAAVRGNGTLVNQPGFYEAFGVKEGDRLYLPKEERVTIW